MDDVEGLIAKGTDKNAIDKNENTPVMVAAANGTINCSVLRFGSVDVLHF